MEILNEFGIKWELLAAQVVNFLILLFLLNKFLYKPLMKVLEERKLRISDSLKNAEEIEKKLEQIVQEKEQRLTEAANEAKVVLKEATDTASQIIEDAKKAASGEANKLLKQASEQVKLEGEKMRAEIKGEIAEIVIIGLQKITGKVLNKTDQKKLINESLKELK